MNKSYIFKKELLGFFIITIVGFLLHFCFEWSGSSKPLALFCAVNESVWEHLKIGFWPAFFFALYEYFVFGRKKDNFLVAKTVALYVIPFTIAIVFYLVKAITGHHYFWLDISLFVIAIALSQIVSYRIITSAKNYSRYNRLSLILLVILIAAFSLFTYFPPKLELFKDTTTNTYGIN
ncbi:MAG: DUF6512 family protein [Lutisporaceae bacterium]